MRAKMVSTRLWITCLSIVAVLGCDRDPGTAPIPGTPPAVVPRVGRILVTAQDSRIRAGTNTQLAAVVLSETSQVMVGQPLQWNSSDASIASVNENGVVRGEKFGNATITARVGDKFGEVTLSVLRGECTEASATLEVGETRSGALNSDSSCLLNGEPADGWQFNVTAPALLEIVVTSGLYFQHLVLTDAQLKPLASVQGTTLRVQLAAGSYIVWILADFDDGAYQLSVNPVQQAMR